MMTADRLIVVLEHPNVDLARIAVDAGATLIASLVYDLEFYWHVEGLGGRMLSVGPIATPLRGRSGMLWRCHDVDELPAAKDAEFVSLSPIFLSASKPDYGPPLGVDALRRADRPVYALGGVDSAARAAACMAAGAAGVAVMGAIARAADPTTVVRDLLAAVAG